MPGLSRGQARSKLPAMNPAVVLGFLCQWCKRRHPSKKSVGVDVGAWGGRALPGGAGEPGRCARRWTPGGDAGRGPSPRPDYDGSRAGMTSRAAPVGHGLGGIVVLCRRVHVAGHLRAAVPPRGQWTQPGDTWALRFAALRSGPLAVRFRFCRFAMLGCRRMVAPRA